MFSDRWEIAIALAPEGAAWRRRAERAASVGAGGGDWGAALTSLRELVPAGSAGGARCSVALSQRWVRFLCVPWSDDIMMGEGAAARYLGSQFEATFGEPAQAWLLCADDAGRHAPRLVCALRRDLMQALQGFAAEAGMALVSVLPWPIAALNRLRKSLPADGWFAAVEPELLGVFELRNGRVGQPLLQPWQVDWRAELARCVARQTLRSGDAAARPVVVADATAWPASAPDSNADPNANPGAHLTASIFSTDLSWPAQLTEVFA